MIKPLISIILMLLLLSACGQKGPLYLQDKASEKSPATSAAALPEKLPETPSKTLPETSSKTLPETSSETLPETSPDSPPDKLLLKPLKIVAAQVQIQQNKTPAWQAVLAQSDDSVNLMRYAIFHNDLLGGPPYQLSVGQAQPIDKKIKIDNNIKQASLIEGGLYLRFRSLERGLNHIPALITAAKTYLQHHPEIHRRSSARDFLTEDRQHVDLFIAIERTSEERTSK